MKEFGVENEVWQCYVLPPIILVILILAIYDVFHVVLSGGRGDLQRTVRSFLKYFECTYNKRVLAFFESAALLGIQYSPVPMLDYIHGQISRFVFFATGAKYAYSLISDNVLQVTVKIIYRSPGPQLTVVKAAFILPYKCDGRLCYLQISPPICSDIHQDLMVHQNVRPPQKAA